MATVGKAYCVLDDNARNKIQAHIDELARKRAARPAQATVLAMLADVKVSSVAIPSEPLDNPIIDSGFVSL